MERFKKVKSVMPDFETFLKDSMEVYKEIKDGAFDKDLIAEIKRLYEEELDVELWANDIYQVRIDREPEKQAHIFNTPDTRGVFIHLSIKRIDGSAVHSWRDLQEIKNQLVGVEHEAIEIYPAESRLVDTANQYHLWCFKEVGVGFPVGFHTRNVMDSELSSLFGADQEPFRLP